MNNAHLQVIAAIQSARRSLRWRSGKAAGHLAKRIRLGHLPPGTTLGEYEALIQRVLAEPNADVYLFRFRETPYPTIVHFASGRLWLVMLDMDGVMETAFLVEKPDEYFADPRFERLGFLQELEE